MVSKQERTNNAQDGRRLARQADKVAKRQVKCFTTYSDIATEYSVNARTVARWAKLPDFPAKGQRGWPKKRVQLFVEKNKLGPFSHKKKRVNVDDGPTLTEVNIKKVMEQAENERIKKERQLVEQSVELGKLINRDQAVRFYLQTVAIVTNIIDAFCDARDRELPDDCPVPEAWPEIRARATTLDQKLQTDIASAMQEFDDDQSAS